MPARTTLQRKNDILASNLLFGFWAFSLVVEIVRTKVLHVVEMTHPLAQVVIYVAYLALYYAIRRGKQWARITLLVYLLFTVLVGIAKEVSGYSIREAAQSQDYLYLVNFVLSYMIPAWALVLVSKKPQEQATT